MLGNTLGKDTKLKRGNSDSNFPHLYHGGPTRHPIQPHTAGQALLPIVVAWHEVRPLRNTPELCFVARGAPRRDQEEEDGQKMETRTSGGGSLDEQLFL